MSRLVHVTTIPMSLTFLRGQVGYMKRRGFHVHAVSSPGTELVEFGRREGVPVTAVPMARDVTPFRDLAAIIRLWKLMRVEKPAIVHAHTPKGGLLGMIAAVLARVPVRIYHLRGLPLLGATGWLRKVLWATEWLACRLAHRVLCVSRSLRDVAVAERICPADKLKVLRSGSGNGVDATGRFDPDAVVSRRADVRQRLGIPANAIVIGFVGRLVRDKGIVELTEAWLQIRKRYHACHLVLVGPFEARDRVPASIRETLQADARVHLPGMDWNTAPLYAAMDLVVLPSYREGFPNVPLEAAAMRLPVITTRVPGCVDAVQDGVTGLLIPPRDARALAGAMRHYLDHPLLREAHGRAARDRVLREFRPESIWEAVYLEYSELLHADYGFRPEPLARELTA
jgi:glycosyltransferase involved in cell wall biosynthesis